MEYLCRTTIPEISDWFTVEGDSPDDAAANFHTEHCGKTIKSLIYQHEFQPGRKETVHFAMVEVQGYEPVVARTFTSGIYRKGGVAPGPSLETIAKALAWDHDPKELVEDGWECEDPRNY